jgi:hypothetical protein
MEVTYNRIREWLNSYRSGAPIGSPMFKALHKAVDDAEKYNKLRRKFRLVGRKTKQ